MIEVYQAVQGCILWLRHTKLKRYKDIERMYMLKGDVHYCQANSQWN
jgi:hypothetical protein